MSHDAKDLDRLYRIISGFEVAFLTTRSREGYLRTRPMFPTPRIPGVDLWFLSHDHTHKVEDIEEHPDVCVSYYRPSDRAYASLSGEALLHWDEARIQRFWKPDWYTWFPKGPDDPGLVCIDINVLHVEYTEMQATTLKVLWSLLKARTRGEDHYLGELQEFDLEG